MASNPQSKGKYWLAGHSDSEITYAEVKELATISETDFGVVSDLTASASALNQAGSVAGAGARKLASFGVSLAATNGAALAYTDQDCLVELGALDTTVADGMQTATHFLITGVYYNPTVDCGETLSASILCSSDSGIATNSEVTNREEIFGATPANGHYKTAEGLWANLSITEVDLDLNGTTIQIARPWTTHAVAKKNIYLAATSALNADATAGRGNCIIEYIVF
jgi:hypothetical protein